MTVPIIPNKSNNDIQAYGSAITYARRYAITAIMNLAAEDDDGAEAKKFGEMQGKVHPKAASPKASQVKTEQQPAPPQIVKSALSTPHQGSPTPAPAAKPMQVDNRPTCEKCGKKITERIKDFSMRRFSKCLCIDCQNVEAKPMAS